MRDFSYSAVVFDMDGVIVDSEPLHQQVETALFLELDAPVSPKEHAGFLGCSSFYMWRQVRDSHGLTQSVDDLVRLERERYSRTLREQGVPLVPGVVELIRALDLNGVALALASSSPMEQIDQVLDLAGSGASFTVRVSGDEVPRSKPDPAIFLLAAERLGVAPGECVVVEDSPNGIAAARAAGMRCIGFAQHTNGHSPRLVADVLCESMADIHAVLLGNGNL